VLNVNLVAHQYSLLKRIIFLYFTSCELSEKYEENRDNNGSQMRKNLSLFFNLTSKPLEKCT